MGRLPLTGSGWISTAGAASRRLRAQGLAYLGRFISQTECFWRASFGLHGSWKGHLGWPTGPGQTGPCQRRHWRRRIVERRRYFYSCDCIFCCPVGDRHGNGERELVTTSGGFLLVQLALMKTELVFPMTIHMVMWLTPRSLQAEALLAFASLVSTTLIIGFGISVASVLENLASRIRQRAAALGLYPVVELPRIFRDVTSILHED